MPFVVTTTHTIPDDAPVTVDMLSDVLRPSRWAGLPVGTASTARVDFVPNMAGKSQAEPASHRHPLDPERIFNPSHLCG